MIHLAVELGRARQVVHLAVHPHPHESLPTRALEQVLELALPSPHQGGHHLDLGPRPPGEHHVGDLGRALSGDRRPVVGAVRHAHPRPEQPEVVVDLGHRAHGGARIVARRLLLDGDGRGEALDGVHVRLLHEPQELAGVGRERLDVAPLALGVDRVEGQRGLARARQAGDHRQAVAGDLDVDVLEVVDPGAADDEVLTRHSPPT